MAVAMAGMYANRHCYDLRVYQFLPMHGYGECTLSGGSADGASQHDRKHQIVCAHPTLGGRSPPWCKILALHDTLSARVDPTDEKSVLAYDYAVWVDSDLVFHDTSRSVPELLREFSAGGEPHKYYAWFPSNWPWHNWLPNTAFMILRNGVNARTLLGNWWDAPSGVPYAHCHMYEQEPLMRMWNSLADQPRYMACCDPMARPRTGPGRTGSTGKVRGAVLLRTTYNAVHAAEWWRHMTDLNYATGPGARANEGRSPTTHLTMSGPIRTAHPRLPDQAFPDVLAAMALQEVARRAGPSGAEHSPTCRSRTLFFHVRNLNRTIGVRPRRPLAQAQRVFQAS